MPPQATAWPPDGVRRLLDEQDLRVPGERPEILGHDPPEAIRHLAAPVHRRDDLVVDVLRPLETLELARRVVLALERLDRVPELLDQLAGLTRERADRADAVARGAQFRQVAHRG